MANVDGGMVVELEATWLSEVGTVEVDSSAGEDGEMVAVSIMEDENGEDEGDGDDVGGVEIGEVLVD